MSKCITKNDLYLAVRKLKFIQFFNTETYGIDIVSFLKRNGIAIESLPWKTKGVRGMSTPAKKYGSGPDIILLNSNRSKAEQNFDCAHEMMHLSFHSNIERKTFNCFDKITPNQDPFLEWQANEGAAEYCVPYRIFIPIVKDWYNDLYNGDICIMDFFLKEMSEKFFVPETVIAHRLKNLRYEIFQFVNGVPIESIEILSNNELKKRDINIQSLYDRAIENYDNQMAELYNNCTF